MIKRLSAARAGGKPEPGGMNSPKQVGRQLPGEERKVPALHISPKFELRGGQETEDLRMD